MLEVTGDGTYHFGLSKKIPNGVFTNLTDIELNHENNTTDVIGFTISVKNMESKEAEEIAERKAVNLTNLMCVRSGVHSECFLKDAKFQEYDSLKKTTKIQIGIGMSVYRPFHANKNDLIKLETNPEFAQRIARLSNVLRSANISDYKGVIQDLCTALNEQYDDRELKYKFLRNALSHNPVCQSTINKIKERFGQNYFQFTSDNRFDFTSIQNLKNLKKEGGDFMNLVFNKFQNE